jgi:hypothetical protein
MADDCPNRKQVFLCCPIWKTSRRPFYLVLVYLLTFYARPALAQGEGKTLREVLTEEQLPADPEKLHNLDKRITSGAELKDAWQFVIAYYLHDPSELLKPPLFIELYDRRTGQWRSRSLESAKAHWRDMDVDCLGSVWGIKASSDLLFLDTHINPSAGCVLILSHALQLRGSLCGWLLSQIGQDELIHERSQVHFAPVHPAEIAIYDLRSGRDDTIFPPQVPTAIRKARSAQLREFYKTNGEWCRQNNDPCNPEEFDSDVQTPVAASASESAIAFLVSYEQIQFVQGDVQKPSGPKEVLYVYRHVDDPQKMEFREMLWSDAKTQFGDVPLQNLLQPETLEKIFAQPAVKNP